MSIENDPKSEKTFFDSRLPRRDVLKWFAAAAVATQLEPFENLSVAAAPAASSEGYGTDPDLSGFYKPGDFWPLTFTEVQRRIVTALGDLILPADRLGPAASELRVHDFIDEWISAPYPKQAADRTKILAGVEWLENESRARFNKGFAELADAEMRAIVDDICWPPGANAAHKKAAGFFQTFRSLAAGAYYSTEPGWESIGYVGNVALQSFDGPPQEVLDKLGVEQTVKSAPAVKTEGFE
jgi:hypothetical protein